MELQQPFHEDWKTTREPVGGNNGSDGGTVSDDDAFSECNRPGDSASLDDGDGDGVWSGRDRLLEWWEEEKASL